MNDDQSGVPMLSDSSLDIRSKEGPFFDFWWFGSKTHHPSTAPNSCTNTHEISTTMPKSIYPGYTSASLLLPVILCLVGSTAHAFVPIASSRALRPSSASSSARNDNAPLQEQSLSRQRIQFCELRLSAADDNDEVVNDAAVQEQMVSSSSSALSSSSPHATTSTTSGFWTTGPESSARPLHNSVYTQVLSTVLPELGAQLRQEYDDHFADPRQPDAARFAWDPWFVAVGDTGNKLEQAEEEQEEEEEEDSSSDNDEEELLLVSGELEASKRQTQYSLKRIQTSQFFSAESYDLLVDELMVLGRSVGLHAITPPWTSMYTDGDQQNWHTDAPQGPLAFVLSVCANEGDFEGGETILLQPQILDFWKGFDSSNGLECGSIVR